MSSFSVKSTHPYVNPSQNNEDDDEYSRYSLASSSSSLSSSSRSSKPNHAINRPSRPSTYQLNNQPTHGSKKGLSVRQTSSAMEDFL